ncbi:MAG: tyrosine-type recombinase/integrase [Humibacillus sp.]|nr:tyrosine-type recombinase/integrase [Humibacillus sp.]MDN5780290.1 tyrosine-type recombinase/integrase [Humibacillus sp.]
MDTDGADGRGRCRGLLEGAMEGFELFLVVDKGVSPATQMCYARHVRTFLVSLAGPDGDVDLRGVAAWQVRAFVTGLGRRYAPESMKLIATAVRSFLGFAWMTGRTATDLTGAVGPVVTHRSGQLPKSLPAADVGRLLASPDRETTTGIRDYALLLLLSRLGLRAGEASGLRLDDIDWQAATITATVKGGGHLLLPLPADVGQALVTYLQRRPVGVAHREVFLQVRGVPAPMNSRAVTQVVARHGVRAGLGPVRAHRLRHSAARAVLVAGGTLVEVGELLGHATSQMSMVYSSFDWPSLAVLARPWPTEVDDA